VASLLKPFLELCHPRLPCTHPQEGLGLPPEPRPIPQGPGVSGWAPPGLGCGGTPLPSHLGPLEQQLSPQMQKAKDKGTVDITGAPRDTNLTVGGSEERAAPLPANSRGQVRPRGGLPSPCTPQSQSRLSSRGEAAGPHALSLTAPPSPSPSSSSHFAHNQTGEQRQAGLGGLLFSLRGLTHVVHPQGSAQILNGQQSSDQSGVLTETAVASAPGHSLRQPACHLPSGF